jgi:hypothetical protein
MRPSLLAAAVAIALAGCQYDPFADRMTTTSEAPPPSSVTGRYVLTEQTAVKGDLAAFDGHPCVVELRPDGTFAATNVPPWEMGGPGPSFMTTLCSGTGKWRIGSVGGVDSGSGHAKTHWGVYLDSEATKLEPAGLTGQKPPFGLMFTLGDPDSGEVMILERAK